MEGEQRGEEEDWDIDRKQDNSGTTKGNKMEQKPNYKWRFNYNIIFIYSIGANSHHNFTEKGRERESGVVLILCT